MKLLRKKPKSQENRAPFFCQCIFHDSGITVASKIEPLSRVRFFGFSTGRFFRRAYFNPNLNANLTTLTTFRPRCFFPLTQTIKAVTLALYSIQQLFIRDIHTKLVSLTVSISRYWTKLRGGVSRFPNFWLNCL